MKNRRNAIILCAVCGVLVLAIIAGTIFAIVKVLSKKDDGEPTFSQGSSSAQSNVSGVDSSSNTSSSSTSSVIKNELLNKGNWPVVQKATMPTISGQTMTQTEMEKLYRPYTDWRIYEIRTTKTEIKPKNGGTAYYISNRGKASNNGLSPETPFNNAGQLKLVTLKPGDVVYFERGSIYRNGFVANVEGVTYTAYGEGKKPEFYTSYDNFTGKDNWEETDQENVYLFADRLFDDVGNIVFDERLCAYKVLLATKGNGDTYNHSDKEEFSDYHDLYKDLQFYHNTTTGKLYLRCDNGNPGELFDRIELSIKGHGVSVRANNVTIDNLCFKYVGSHGVSAGTNEGLTVQNCEFGWIGGAIQMVNNGVPVRFGNGAEIYGSAKNFTVQNCYFYQNYDAGPTFQYKNSDVDRPQIVMSNIKFANNVMEYCNYSIEYFLTSSEDSYIENVTIDGNLMWYAGEGFCSQRPSKTENTHIKSWGHENRLKGYFKITNNLFCLAQRYLSETYDITGIGADYESNVYIQFVTKSLGRNSNTNEFVRFGYLQDAIQRIKSEFKDSSAKVICIVSDSDD